MVVLSNKNRFTTAGTPIVQRLRRPAWPPVIYLTDRSIDCCITNAVCSDCVLFLWICLYQLNLRVSFPVCLAFVFK